MPNIWTTCLIVLAFFFAYYVYEPPYRGPLPGSPAREHVRPLAGRAAHPARDGARASRSSAADSCSRSGTRRPFLLAARRDDRRLRRRRAARARSPGATGSRVFEGVRTLPADELGRSSARCRRSGASCSPTRRGRARSRRCGRSSSSTSRRASASRSRRLLGGPRRRRGRLRDRRGRLASRSATGSGSRG